MSIRLRVLGKIRKTIESIIFSIQRKTDKQFVALERWYQEDPHNLRRSTFEELTNQSIVFDLGGYEGQWTSDISARYNCNIYVFEPVKEYFDIIKERFKNNPKIECFQFGLSGRNYDTEITIDEFASSTFHPVKASKEVKRTETITIKSFNEFLNDTGISKVDLMKINIEGGEYDLLEGIIASGNAKSIDRLLVQFHSFVPDAQKRKMEIENILEKTHELIFSYWYVWDLWKLKI